MIKIIIFIIVLNVSLNIILFIILAIKELIKIMDEMSKMPDPEPECEHDWEILEETDEKKINYELKSSPLMPFHARSKKYNQVSLYASYTDGYGFHYNDTEKTYINTNRDLYNQRCKICGKEDFQIKRYIRACKAFYDMK